MGQKSVYSHSHSRHTRSTVYFIFLLFFPLFSSFPTASCEMSHFRFCDVQQKQTTKFHTIERNTHTISLYLFVSLSHPLFQQVDGAMMMLRSTLCLFSVLFLFRAYLSIGAHTCVALLPCLLPK